MRTNSSGSATPSPAGVALVIVTSRPAGRSPSQAGAPGPVATDSSERGPALPFASESSSGPSTSVTRL
ncbi:hypothetical protein ACFQ0T_31200 [Kitasatospora gansuensis]